MEPLQHRTLVDRVVDAIMRAASEGRLKPGERVVEAEIARQLGVSRVPIREALRLLESLGIVTNIPYRGMRLMEVDDETTIQKLRVRFALERLAAIDYLMVAEKQHIDLAPLRQCIDTMRAASLVGDSYSVALADTEFHRILCGLTGNSVLQETWEPLARQMTIIFGIGAKTKGLDTAVGEHEELLAALKKRDRLNLIKVLREHIFADFDGNENLNINVIDDPDDRL
jgi:DNA-binding GntR family transcriptional regulator